MNKSCFEISENTSTGTGSGFGYRSWLLNIVFQCMSCINKITSRYQLSDYFEELYYYFISSIANRLFRGSAQGVSSTFVGW